MVQELEQEFFIDPVMKKQLDDIIRVVTKKDRDYVLVVDGEEGSGKSVLAMQLAKYLDPKFNLDRVVFNSDGFMKAIKSIPRYSCILLDEAYNAANSRAALTEVNRSMVAVGTEMRQRNLFVIMVLPSFFDLDKYFALWRCRALIHTYFDKKGDRGRYIVFPRTSKKYLYINGKKKYDYSKPHSPYPACRFNNHYTVDELAYREKKSLAFTKRTVSNQARKWFIQRNAYIKYIFQSLGLTQEELARIPAQYGGVPLSHQQISNIMQEIDESPRD